MRFCLVIGAFVMLSWPAMVSAQVVFTEVLWAGSSVSYADEWFELMNISEEPVSLEGWSVTGRSSDGSDVEMIVFEDIMLEPSEVLLVANYDADKSALSVHPHVVDTAVSLANSQLYLQLLDTDQVVIDAVDDGSGAPFAGGKEPYASMQRVDVHGDGTVATSWQTASLSVGLDGEVLGDPGVFVLDSTASSTSSSSSSSVTSSSAVSVSSVPQTVIISEVMTNPDDHSDYEWVELHNTGDRSVNVLGWHISDESRSHEIAPRSASGYVLKSDEYALFFGYQTGLKLSNNGEIITLSHGDDEVDRLEVDATARDVSFGRKADGSRAKFCVATPREANTDALPEVEIVTQSGRATDYDRVTLNLKVESITGSLDDAMCLWDFKDNTSSDSCNPPSHSWDYPGVYDIDVVVTTSCGDEIRKALEVVVLQKNRYRGSSISSQSSSRVDYSDSSSSIYSSKSLISSKKSAISSEKEQKMYSSSARVVSSVAPVDLLPVRYRNVVPAQVVDPREASSSSFDSRIISLMEANLNREVPAGRTDESGLPWLLLFSQSALWVILAGKKFI